MPTSTRNRSPAKQKASRSRSSSSRSRSPRSRSARSKSRSSRSSSPRGEAAVAVSGGSGMMSSIRAGLFGFGGGAVISRARKSKSNSSRSGSAHLVSFKRKDGSVVRFQAKSKKASRRSNSEIVRVMKDKNMSPALIVKALEKRGLSTRDAKTMIERN